MRWQPQTKAKWFSQQKNGRELLKIWLEKTGDYEVAAFYLWPDAETAPDSPWRTWDAKM